ncbi:MAG: DUF512 domain-containing protein [Acidimicrobiales bacterium]
MPLSSRSSTPTVEAVKAGTPAALAGLLPGDELVEIVSEAGEGAPRDVIDYALMVDPGEVELRLRRAGVPVTLEVRKQAGEPLGATVSSAVFDRVRTCDNHCEFCFIHQLPKGMRRSLYLKDDDYRLSFLYGNFTTLTRFTELDFERVVTERLSPLYVSIHATDPDARARMLRNPRGAVSLRWLSALLASGIEVHGQVVVCPGVNDGDVLVDTMAGILDEYSALTSVGVVPLGVSRFSPEPAMRPHSRREAEAVVSTVQEWQQRFSEVLGRRIVHAADEYYLLAGVPFPRLGDYEGLPQHENGVGMARSFEEALLGPAPGRSPAHPAARRNSGFFASVDGAPATGYRAERLGRDPGSGAMAEGGETAAEGAETTTVLTGEYGAQVIEPLIDRLGSIAPIGEVRVQPVKNAFFGGNIAVTGLLVGADVAGELESQRSGGRFLLPDACLSEGRFLDGLTLADLPRPVEVVASDGASLRQALEARG